MANREIQIFDLLEFPHSGSVASVRRLTGKGDHQVATLRYMRDDGELEFYPFEMRTVALLKITKPANVEPKHSCSRADKRQSPKASQPKLRFAALQACLGVGFASPIT